MRKKSYGGFKSGFSEFVTPEEPKFGPKRKCVMCGKIFSNPVELDDHGCKPAPTAPIIIHCPKCNKEYDSVQLPITEHRKQCSGNPPVVSSNVKVEEIIRRQKENKISQKYESPQVKDRYYSRSYESNVQSIIQEQKTSSQTTKEVPKNENNPVDVKTPQKPELPSDTVKEEKIRRREKAINDFLKCGYSDDDAKRTAGKTYPD